MALPQNYQTTAPSVFEACGTFADWSWIGTAGNGTIEDDPAHGHAASSGIKINVSVAGATSAAEKTISLDIKPYKRFGIWVYNDGTFDPTSTFYVYLSSQANLSKFFHIVWSGYVIRPGWNFLTWRKVDMVNNNTDSLTATMVRLRFKIFSGVGKTPSLTVGGVYAGMHNTRGRVVICFDDEFASQYNTVFPLMTAMGLRGTLYVVNGDADGVGTAGKATLSQLQEMYAAGWAIGTHTSHHVDMRALPDHGYANICEGRDYLLANNMPRCAYHLAYPFGFSNPDVHAAAVAAGMLTARGTQPWHQDAANQIYDIFGGGLNNTTTLAAAKAYVDSARVNEATYFITTHDVVDNPTESYQWSTANLTALLKYIVDSRVEVLTLDEWYNGLTNPRYRSVPVVRT